MNYSRTECVWHLKNDNITIKSKFSIEFKNESKWNKEVSFIS